MKKNISFEKKLEFPTMIGEVTSISLDHNLTFINQSNIEGNFLIKGAYKLTEASCIEENFEFNLPVEILLNEKLDINTSKIEIEDFYYEIENEENLICYIDVLVEGVEEIIEEQQVIVEPPIEELTRECDGDVYNEKVNENAEIETLEQIEEKAIMKQEKEEVQSLFSSLKDDEDTFATYSVYILRQEETIQTILQKYKITKEELEDYNDLSNITTGSKIIVPIHE